MQEFNFTGKLAGAEIIFHQSLKLILFWDEKKDKKMCFDLFQDYGSYTNLPSLLIEGHGLLTAASHLRYVNETLHKK